MAAMPNFTVSVISLIIAQFLPYIRDRAFKLLKQCIKTSSFLNFSTLKNKIWLTLGILVKI